jgi:four helix bundle protein
VWQRSIDLIVAIYSITHGFPAEERFGLTSQLRRASVSVASNIAEGCGRGSTNGYRHFLGMARGSTAEVQTQLVISRRLKLSSEIGTAKADGLADEIHRMLVSLIAKLRTPPYPVLYDLLTFVRPLREPAGS